MKKTSSERNWKWGYKKKGPPAPFRPYAKHNAIFTHSKEENFDVHKTPKHLNIKIKRIPREINWRNHSLLYPCTLSRSFAAQKLDRRKKLKQEHYD